MKIANSIIHSFQINTIRLRLRKRGNLFLITMLFSSLSTTKNLFIEMLHIN